jgi:predicted alpha/beta hydrolase family esterase
MATLRDYSRNLLNSLKAISEGKQRPIIFVCHSLGGIVCKQVSSSTILSQEDPNLF